MEELKDSDMLNKIVNWAKDEDAVRAIILTGSRGAKSTIDEFSDFDIALFVSDPKKHVSNDSWINEIGKPWVYIQEKISFENQQIPVFLIVFENGVCADVSLWDSRLLETLVNKRQLPFACSEGYSVLLDKDGVAAKLPTALGKRVSICKPTEKEFLSAINIFFFEVFNCAKYIARADLWHAKLRDWTTKEYLLKMIEWNEAAKHNWDYDTFWHGKRMQSWVDKNTWSKLHDTFGHFGVHDSWKALDATVNLFRIVATQTAKNLEFQYPANVDENISRFIKDIRSKGV